MRHSVVFKEGTDTIIGRFKGRLGMSKKHPELMTLSFTESIELLIIIASLSNIKGNDARMDAVIDFIKNKRISVDTRMIDNLANKILMELG